MHRYSSILVLLAVIDLLMGFQKEAPWQATSSLGCLRGQGRDLIRFRHCQKGKGTGRLKAEDTCRWLATFFYFYF